MESKNKRTFLARLRRLLLRRQGSALVEAAAVMPLFSLILIGSAEFGRIAYYAIEVSNAAYAGATYAAQSRTTAANSSAIQQAVNNDAANITGITTTSSMACYCSSSPGTTVSCSTVASSCVSPNRIQVSVQVNTSASVNSMFSYPGIPPVFNLSGRAVAMVEK